MKFWTAYIIFGLSFLQTAVANEHGGGHAAAAHHGQMSDLIAPVVNVVLLIGFLVWKLKKPLSEKFTAQAEEISNMLERASLKSKEAEVMLSFQEKKMANLDSELKEILRTTDSEIKAFDKNYAREIEEKSFKLKTDATAKIEAERKAILDDLHASVLDEVIRKTKSTITGNKDFQAKASARMLGDIVQ